MVSLLRSVVVALAILALVAPPRKSSIRQIDFRNFAYPWDGEGAPEDYWHWIDSIPSTTVQLAMGVHRFHEGGDAAEDPDLSPGLWLESVTYGDLEGDGKEEAAVDLNYSGGGTANWDYLYVYELDKGVPRLVGWLESGSRAYGGLIGVVIRQRRLVLDFQDPQRADGDCCSDGYVRVRYVRRGGHFVETGTRERGDLKPAKRGTTPE